MLDGLIPLWVRALGIATAAKIFEAPRSEEPRSCPLRIQNPTDQFPKSPQVGQRSALLISAIAFMQRAHLEAHTRFAPLAITLLATRKVPTKGGQKCTKLSQYSAQTSLCASLYGPREPANKPNRTESSELAISECAQTPKLNACVCVCVPLESRH